MLLAGGFVVLVSHRSGSPAIFGRYSLPFFVFLGCYVAWCFTLALSKRRQSMALPSHRNTAAFALVLWTPVLGTELLPPLRLDHWVGSAVLPMATSLALALDAALVAGLSASGLLVMRGILRRSASAQGQATSCGVLLWLSVGAIATLGSSEILGTILASSALAVGAALMAGRVFGLRAGAALCLSGAACLQAAILYRFYADDQVRAGIAMMGALGATLWLASLFARGKARAGIKVISVAVCLAGAAAPWLMRRPATEPTRGTASRRLPHVLLIVVDTWRADHTGPWGYRLPTTPNLDELVGERTTLFTQAWSPATSTVPSVKAIFTAAAPSAWGLEDAGNRGPPTEATTLAEAFASAGYTTGGFTANWLIRGDGFEQGFTTFEVFEGLDFMVRSIGWNSLLCARDWWCVLSWAERLRLHKEDGFYVWETARAWMEAQEHPMFVYLHLVEPHWPYHQRGYGWGDPSSGGFLATSDLVKLGPAATEFAGDPRLTELVGRYDEEVRHTDSILAKVTSDLRRLGWLDNTVVAITGDHGEEFLEHGGFGHGHDVFPELAHVPLLIRWPAGERFASLPSLVEEPVSIAAVFPTLSALLGVPEPEPPATIASLTSIMSRSGTAGPVEPVVVEAYRPGRLIYGYREGGWAVRLATAASLSPQETVDIQLFRAGPGASLSLSAAEDLIGRGRAALAGRWGRGVHPPEKPHGSVGDADAALDSLRALGYVQ